MFDPEIFRLAAQLRGPNAMQTGLTMPAPAGAAGPLAQAAPEKKGGILGGVKSFIGSDEGKATLIRAGARMLEDGNIGAGVGAGAEYYERRRLQDLQQEMQERALALQEEVGRGQLAQGSRRLDQGERQIDMQGDQFDRTFDQRGDQFDRTMNQRDDQFGQTMGYQYKTLEQQEELARLADQTRRYGINVNRDVSLRGQNLTNSRFYHDQDRQDQRQRLGILASQRTAALGGDVDPVGDYSTEIPGAPATTEGGILGFFGTPVPAKPARKVKEDVFPLVPRQSRVPGRVYQTPQGPSRWGGDTWVE